MIAVHLQPRDISKDSGRCKRIDWMDASHKRINLVRKLFHGSPRQKGRIRADMGAMKPGGGGSGYQRVTCWREISFDGIETALIQAQCWHTQSCGLGIEGL